MCLVRCIDIAVYKRTAIHNVVLPLLLLIFNTAVTGGVVLLLRLLFFFWFDFADVAVAAADVRVTHRARRTEYNLTQ